jgi:hypothetical protein
MATVSDYVIVTDNRTRLPGTDGDKDQTFAFSIPSNINRDERAVATWVLEVEASPQNLAWNLTINDKQLVAFTHSNDRFAALQEVFDGEILQPGTFNNIAKVTITGGTGQIRFSDFVVHFRVDV